MNIVIAIVAITSALVGGVIGWVWRSMVFVADRDCANPDHGDIYDRSNH